MNIYGLETERMGLVCDWFRPTSDYLDDLVYSLRINYIRVPFSYDYLLHNDFTKLDMLVKECEIRNISIILDWHRNSASHQGPTPEEFFSLQTFVDSWLQLLRRYNESKAVQGVGIYNEVQLNDVDYVINMHNFTIHAIEEVFPNRFLYFAGCPEWGGNCAGMGALMTFSMWDRIYIETHQYIFSGDANENSWNKSLPEGIPSNKWFIGETGWKISQTSWAITWLEYLQRRHISNVCLWTLALSWDTDGWWQDNCQFPENAKFETMQIFWNLTKDG